MQLVLLLAHQHWSLNPVNNVELKTLAKAAGVGNRPFDSTLLGTQHYTTGGLHEFFDPTGITGYGTASALTA